MRKNIIKNKWNYLRAKIKKKFNELPESEFIKIKNDYHNLIGYPEWQRERLKNKLKIFKRITNSYY
ncbi:hypothetical protein ACFPDQ_04275 [Pseudofrancisella aestuarii]|uniref:Uncharacterized protein n=1 Tax=Pseudofrancisella aestuarii TaxID=2670347 RepID=A0ABV9TAV8_9GAMM|nr:hypothetical protein [Pseudofrancisella aestuarii]